jgi:hypothetical protein
MADNLLSLGKARKAKARIEKEAAAEAKRLKFGRTKAERERDEALKALAERRLDDSRLDK